MIRAVTAVTRRAAAAFRPAGCSRGLGTRGDVPPRLRLGNPEIADVWKHLTYTSEVTAKSLADFEVSAANSLADMAKSLADFKVLTAQSLAVSTNSLADFKVSTAKSLADFNASTAKSLADYRNENMKEDRKVGIYSRSYHIYYPPCYNVMKGLFSVPALASLCVVVRAAS